MLSSRRFKYWINKFVWSGFIIMLLLLIIIISKNIGRIDVLCHDISSISTSKSNIRREAIVSIFSGDSYLPAILVLGYSLNKYNVSNNRDMIVLIPSGGIFDSRHIAMIQIIGWTVKYVKRIPYPGKVHPQLINGLLKLYAWNMTQYDIIATLDADSMIVHSIEEPFQQMRTNSDIQMLAVDDAGIPSSYRKELRSYFNSGVLFFRPNTNHFTQLVHLSSKKSYYDLTYPQQNLLNKYFRDQWVQLPSAFNMLEHLNGKHPIWVNQTENLRIIHFAGSHKPWDALHSTKRKKFNADLIWRRFFTILVTENGWQKEDFLVPLASPTFRQKLKYDQWITKI